MSLVSLFFLYTLFFFFFFFSWNLGIWRNSYPSQSLHTGSCRRRLTHQPWLAVLGLLIPLWISLSPLVSAHRTAALTFCSPLFSAASKLSDNSIGAMKQNRIQFFWQPAPRQARMLDAQTTLASIPRGGALAWVDFLTGAMPRRGRGTNRCTTCRNLPTPGAGIPS